MKRKLTSKNHLVTFTSVDSKVLQQIQLVELKASFGSKIDNLTRHLLVNPFATTMLNLRVVDQSPRGSKGGCIQSMERRCVALPRLSKRV